MGGIQNILLTLTRTRSHTNPPPLSLTCGNTQTSNQKLKNIFEIPNSTTIFLINTFLFILTNVCK